MKQIGAVILAAGASSRLGTPKQLVNIAVSNPENLLERSLSVAVQAACSPIVVVLGAFAQQIQAKSNLGEAHVLCNEAWAEGMAGSIRLGVEYLQQAEGIIIMTCDMPAVSSSHLRALSQSGELTASSYAGRRGVPGFFPRPVFPALLQLQGDAGARHLLRSAPAIELPGGDLDIDTEAELKIAQARFRKRERE